jgi:lysophospholipase L1-like esterase
MTFMNCYQPWRRTALLVAAVMLSLVAPASCLMAHAETTVQAALAPRAGTASAPSSAGPAVVVQQANPTEPTASPQPANPPPAGAESGNGQAATPLQSKSLTAKAIDKVRQVAKSASDIFNRVPCLPPKGGAKPFGTLPHVAAKLATGKPVLIVAFGSSSTQGYGSSSPDYTDPNRLAAQLRRHYPSSDIRVVNAGVGGEDAPEMMKRLQSAAIDPHPDLVIWQVGTNAVLRGLDPAETAKQVEDGVARIQAAGSDVVLVDPQYSPRVIERPESTNKIVQLLGKIAQLRHVGIFPRFEVMREWHERQAIPINDFVIADGLHMNDWGYACFAQILGDDIIMSVGQVKLGVNVPSGVQTYRPM